MYCTFCNECLNSECFNQCQKCGEVDHSKTGVVCAKCVKQHLEHCLMFIPIKCLLLKCSCKYSRPKNPTIVQHGWNPTTEPHGQKGAVWLDIYIFFIFVPYFGIILWASAKRLKTYRSIDVLRAETADNVPSIVPVAQIWWAPTGRTPCRVYLLSQSVRGVFSFPRVPASSQGFPLPR